MTASRTGSSPGKVLRGAGFRTLQARHGAEAIALAAEHLPEVILEDLRLPDMDGTDAARALGEEVRTARTPVVALSAMPLESGADRILAAGFAGFLDKPIEVRGFAERVRRHCVGPGG